MSYQELSEDQRSVFDAIQDWLADPSRSPYLTVGGLAGTGKTTLIAAVARNVEAARRLGHEQVVKFAAFTGKASTVLARKLRPFDIAEEACSTLHSLMYRAQVNQETGALEGWEKKSSIAADLIVVDEASMLSHDLWQDLLGYGIPVLAVGDHGQLPPIGSNSINLMQAPDLTLTRIHRQAADNPILALAHHVRAGGSLTDFQSTGDRVRFIPRNTFPEIAGEFADGSLDSVILCAYNSTRVRMNAEIRRLRGFKDLLSPGEIVICLKNAKPVFNGMRGIANRSSFDVELDYYGRLHAMVNFVEDGVRWSGKLQSQQFGKEATIAVFNELPGKPMSWRDAGHLFDYGYAMTVHKSQGSEYKKVAVCVEWFKKATEDERVRWIYTAITRASEQLYLVY